MNDFPRGLAAFSLQGRKALITGGNRGLGYAFTQALADCGASVAFIGRSADANRQAVTRLADVGVHAHAISADLSRDDDVQRSVDEAVERGGNVRLAVMAVAFFAVAREGLEAALFLIAAATTERGVDVLVGGLGGLAVAGVLGWLVVLGGRRLPMRQFFTVTGLVLLVFAAGLVSRTVLYLQLAGELGTVWNNVYDLTGYPWLTVNTETGRFLGAMLGWDPRPSIEQVVAYLAFLGTVGWLFLRPPKSASSQPSRPLAGASDTRR